MNKMPAHKYRPYPIVDLPDRKWPSRTITSAPRWCSVDLRDGNQALVVPMSVEEKKELFGLLIGMGFREIEVGFPSASKTEYDFTRLLIEEDLIPEGVTIQVLTQAREHLIRKSFEALKGCRRAIVHLYNSTSELQRRVVFGLGRKEVIDLAVRGAECIREEAILMPETEFLLQYSPESFTGTEQEFAVDICEAVMDVWRPSVEKKVILNIPATVEMATPNVYADRVEWFCRKIMDRDRVIISVHAHNDRGTAIAATELALLAGADRVEGTLFGNGERTGNVDLLTVAMNMYSQGVDPNLDFGDIDKIAGVYERCTKMPVHARHPYAGELVYTAFSGSHQDAINKGMKALGERPDLWEVPYLPIDPSDVGRTYESIIRINSQSGKGGIAYLMEKDFGIKIPREMQPEFGLVIQAITDKTGSELTPPMLRDAFKKEYIEVDGPYKLMKFGICQNAGEEVEVHPIILDEGIERGLSGKGNGPIDAFSNALRDHLGIDLKLLSYFEHAIEKGSDSRAAAYIQIEYLSNIWWGAGIDTNIDRASFKAILGAINRAKIST
ncbi:MAG TPA: 2-isopropylmalate synthase [Dissulfurispiraceae bacterium]|nr:2-isopropylmalate synthase [Dissulfurispiraceae bacterium]